MPPSQTKRTVPKAAAAMPLWNVPSSLEALMKIMFTAAIRPRMCSGDSRRRIARRMTTLTPSKTPLIARAAIDR